MMEKKRLTLNEDRLREVVRLYRSGLTLREIGDRLSPPVTAARVGQILDQSVRFALYPDLRAERRDGVDVTAAKVREAAYSATTRRRIAQILKMDPDVLERRFGAEIDAVFEERRLRASAARPRRSSDEVRRKVVDEYLALAAEMGRNPTTTSLRGTGLVVRIFKHFGTFQAFLGFAGVRANYAKRALHADRDSC